MAHDELVIGDLTAMIGDNSADGQHRAGYNGIWSLKHRACPRSLFVPAYAGLNLEHVMDGDHEFHDGVFFEPRQAPMAFRRTAKDTAELHQPATPTFGMESTTTFRLTPPHSIDVTVSFMPRKPVYTFGWAGLFWASYIDAPDDKSVYFVGGAAKGQNLWTQLCTQTHGDESTVRGEHDDFVPTNEQNDRGALFTSISPLRYALPFYYGRFENLTWIVMFDGPDLVRFSHSPSGGGVNTERRTTCPAWDFLYVVPKIEVNRTYTLRYRAALRRACTRAEVLAEYDGWRASRAVQGTKPE